MPRRGLWTQPLRRLLAEPVFVLERLLQRPLPGLAILTYHSISETPGHDCETVSPAHFEAQLAWLAGQGIQGVTVSMLLSGAALGRSVALSFDDGYADNASIAAPILKRLGHRASFYVATRYLGATSSWNAPDYIGHRPMLTDDDVRALASEGHEIGSHGHGHLDMTRLSDDEIDDELLRSRDRLSSLVGEAVHGFACPFGRAHAGLRQRVAQAGYRHMVFGGRFALNRLASDPFSLVRISILRTDSLREFAKKATGAYRWLAFRERPVA